LALEADMDVFIEVFELLVIVPIFKATRPIVNIGDEDLLVEKQPKRILDYE
jgi:hypothetical protein